MDIWRNRAVACLLALLMPLAAAQPLLVLDSGHTPSKGGALGTRGEYEVVYNDRFVSGLKTALEKDGWQVLLTRQPEQEITLAERAALANRQQADVFVSLHHDSAQLQYLEQTSHHGKQAYRTIRPIRGYSLFVSALNPQYSQSKQLATEIGRALRALGRQPTLHHAEPIEGENRPLLDAANGVYRYDGLAVLKQTEMPAVLLEIGVIVDEQDEAYVSDAANRQKMIEAVVRALKAYWKH